MTRYTLHVPEQYNTGALVGETVLDEIEHLILNVAGGFTRTSAVGAWRSDDGTIYREPMRLYLVDSEDVGTGERLHDLARRIRSALTQEAVYLTEQDIGTTLIYA